MTQEESLTVPYLVYESSLAREERHNKRLTSIILTICIFWLVTVVGCLWYISLPVEESTEISQTAEDVDSGSVTQTIGDE